MSRWTAPVRRIASASVAVGSLVLLAPRTGETQERPGRFTFAVVGHIRGNTDPELHPRLDELVEELRRLKPDLLFLTGDMIWGSVPQALTDSAAVAAQWDRLDARLEALGIPIFRVPGNHDIHDPVTRDVFLERYGPLPRTLNFRGSRFFLLNSTFTPAGNDSVPLAMKLGKTVRLDSVQVGFVRRQLERERFAHNFLLMHHVLWWEEGAPWWQELHPTLAAHGVDAVFAGDLGPAMYTHMTRDSVEYFRTTLNAIAHRAGAASTPAGLIHTVQFENFLLVTVDGPSVSYRVHTIGAISSSAFAPARWREAFGSTPDPGRYYDPASYRPPPPASKAKPGAPSLLARLWGEIGSPRRLAAIGLFAILVFGAGVLAGRRPRRRPAD